MFVMLTVGNAGTDRLSVTVKVGSSCLRLAGGLEGCAARGPRLSGGVACSRAPS